MQKPKILFITGSYSNGRGAATVLNTLIKHVNTDKYDIHVLQYFNDNHVQNEKRENVTYLESVMDGKRAFKREFWYIGDTRPAINKELLNLHGYDIIIAWDTYTILPAFYHEKKITWLHSGIDNINKKSKDGQYKKKAWDASDVIITISKWPYNSLIQQFPQYKDKTQIIYNGIDENHILCGAKEPLQSTVNFNDNTLPILCMVGALDATKNPELLLHAMQYTKTKCNIIFVGRGDKKDILEDLVEKYKLTGQVYFAGFQSNPYPYIKVSTLVCLCSTTESFPTTICEGMVLGKPFVTTPVAGASEELANNGKCGLVSDYTPEKFAKCIDEILSDTKKYKEMSKACVEHVKEFSVERNIEKFDELIASLNITSAKHENLSIKFLCTKFAHYCIVSAFDNIPTAWKIFFRKTNIYNTVRLGYYHLRAFIMMIGYPIFFIKYFKIAKDLQKRFSKS